MPKKFNFEGSVLFESLLKSLKKNGTIADDPTLLDPDTPLDVIETCEPRKPEFDPTCGIPGQANNKKGSPPHRLVTIGDSLTHGFQSGAIFNTDLSYPSIIAYELGFDDAFRYPRYFGFGGLPLNIELLIRNLSRRFGNEIDWWELAPAAFEVRQHMAQLEDWWERGPGSHVPQFVDINHNLGVYGWDIRDVLDRTAEICKQNIEKPKNNIFRQIIENANDRAALRVLNYLLNDDPRNQLTALGQAEALGNQGKGNSEGIETLIILLGSNNVLGAVLGLKVNWSRPGYDQLAKKGNYNVWRPIHFEAELKKLAVEVRKIKARHVIWGTVPHVTIPPITRGVSEKVRKGSRYFPYYTRPWISDAEFDVKEDPHLTEQQARAIDSAIDQYNYCIAELVRSARSDPADPKDWYLLDVAGILDRLAARRYINDPNARPSWWTKYELPSELTSLSPIPDSQFFSTDVTGKRIKGGLFSLDGVHPTTIAYGLMAQEFINVMQVAGVTFYLGDQKTPRLGPVKVDMNRLIKLDTLIADPPHGITSDLALIAWFDQKLDVFRRLMLLN